MTRYFPGGGGGQVYLNPEEVLKCTFYGLVYYIINPINRKIELKQIVENGKYSCPIPAVPPSSDP